MAVVASSNREAIQRHEAAVRSIVERHVNEALQVYGQFVCDVAFDFTFDGDPAIFVDVCYYDVATRVPQDVTSKLSLKLRHSILELEDERYPYLVYRFDAVSK